MTRTHLLGPRVRGLLWALLGLSIAAAFPVVTRLGVTGQGLTPLQLAALRYGIAGVLLLPVLVVGARTLGPAEWAEGALLAALQGTPLALLVAYALIHTPAAHGAALTLGLMPAAILVVGALAGARAPRLAGLGALLIAGGAVALAVLAEMSSGGGTLAGHAMLVAAAFLGAGYFVRLRRSGFTALQGAAFVAVFSGVGGVAALLLVEGPGPITALDGRTLAAQALYQGVLAGVVWTVATNRSIALLGAAPAAACLSLVPGLAALLAVPVLREVPSAGVTLALAVMVMGALLSAAAPRPGTSFSGTLAPWERRGGASGDATGGRVARSVPDALDLPPLPSAPRTRPAPA